MTSVGNNLPASATGQALDELYKQGLEQVRKNAAYIFAKGGYADWALCTWSRKIIPSAIKNNGTAADKARLVLGRIPVPHQRKRKRKASIENNGHQQLILAPAPAQQRLIPAVENSELPRPAGIPDEVVVAPAAAAAGRPTYKGRGCCAVQGCTRASGSTDHDHQCYKRGCPYFVHNLCVQDHFLSDDDNELNMYCSTACKEQG
jgi:hypothetical protein